MRIFMVSTVPVSVQRLRDIDTYVRSLAETDEILLVARNEFLRWFCGSHPIRVFTGTDLLKQNSEAVQTSDLVVGFTNYRQTDSQLVIHSVTMARLCGRPVILNPQRNGGIQRGRVNELVTANR